MASGHAPTSAEHGPYRPMAANAKSCGDIHAARFNVWFRAPFGHRRVARLCRRLTLSGRRTKSARSRPIDATEAELIDLRS